MTRETKVGIVVSCSFLGLLGVVVTSKLRGERPPDRPETPTKAAAVTDKPTSTPNSKPAQSAPLRKRNSNLLAKTEKGKAAPVSSTDKNSASAPPVPSSTPRPDGERQREPAEKSASEVVPAPPVAAPEQPGNHSPPAPIDGEVSKPAPAPPQPTQLAPTEGAEVPLADNPLGSLGSFFSKSPTAEPSRAEVKASLIEETERATKGKSAVPPAPTGPTTETQPEEIKPAAVEKPETTAAGSTGESKPDVPLPGASGEPVSAPPPPPGADPATVQPVTEVAPRSVPDKDKKKPLTADVETPVLRPVRVPTGGAEPEESSPAAPEKRPTTPAVLAPAVARTTAGTRPKVDVFSVEEYAVQAGDTFATISKAKYHSDKYAEALRLFNANDALLSDAGRDAAVNLQPGQSITIPDLTILEKRYSHVIQGLPAGGALVPEGTSRKAEFEIRPVVDVRAVPGAAPTYEVRQEGVTMREVAAKVLGNGDRWNEILRLNKEYNPERALPVGVVLKLPADARVPVPVAVP